LGNISPLKNKSEVSQQFYIFEGQTGISVDEAYRFLQNRWLEKQMQVKQKLGNTVSESDKNESGSSSNGRLIKKNVVNSKINKRRKMHFNNP
jgi:hypothetical protein